MCKFGVEFRFFVFGIVGDPANFAMNLVHAMRRTDPRNFSGSDFK